MFDPNKPLMILGKPHKITFVDNVEVAANFMGKYNSLTAEIKVCNIMPYDTQQETILHEVIHALDDSLHLGFEEGQVQALSNLLYCVLKENNVIS